MKIRQGATLAVDFLIFIQSFSFLRVCDGLYIRPTHINLFNCFRKKLHVDQNLDPKTYSE